jgi:hypothetical protein
MTDTELKEQLIGLDYRELLNLYIEANCPNIVSEMRSKFSNREALYILPNYLRETFLKIEGEFQEEAGVAFTPVTAHFPIKTEEIKKKIEGMNFYELVYTFTIARDPEEERLQWSELFAFMQWENKLRLREEVDPVDPIPCVITTEERRHNITPHHRESEPSKIVPF